MQPFLHRPCLLAALSALLWAAGPDAAAQAPARPKPVVTAPAARPVAAKPATPPVPPVPAAPAEPWFDTIPGPLPLAEADAARVAAELFKNLGAGKIDGPAFLSFLPPDTVPRVVILSWRGPSGRAESIAGAGRGLRAAAADALTQAWSLPGVTRTPALRVDLVQNAVIHRGFVIRQDPLPHPGLVGLAFSHDSGFFFLPERLCGQGLLRGAGLLDVNRVGEELLAARDMTRLGYWNLISSYQDPQEVTFFETQAFFVTAAGATPLFRGHRLPAPLGAAALREAGRACAAFLARHTAADGTFAAALPGWRLPASGEEARGDLAAAALAQFAWLAADPEGGQRDAAAAMARWLAARLAPPPGDRTALCLPEFDRTTLGTNALATLALLHLQTTAKDDRRLARALDGLGRHLLAQRQPDGALVCVRALPSGSIRGETSVRDQALAIVALTRLYETTGRIDYLDAAEQALRSLIGPGVATRDMERLPQDGWLLAAIDDVFTHRRDDAFLLQAERLGRNLVATQTLEAVFPDFIGTWDRSPALAEATGRGYGLLRAARLLRDARLPGPAQETLAAAHLALLFQLQGQFDPAASLFFPATPDRSGAFRDDLAARTPSLSLRQQADSLLCLAEATRLTTRLQGVPLPLTPGMRDALAAARRQAATFPRCLPRKLE